MCVGDVRDGPDRRHLGARRRARRGRGHRRGGHAVDQAVPAGAALASASSSTSTSRAPTATSSARASTRSRTDLRPAARAGVAGRGRRRRAGARLGRVRRDRVRRGVAHPAPDGAHPQPLRRPDVHRAAAVDPALRREGEAEPGPQHPRRPARRPRRRLDRARHDVAGRS